MVGDGGGDPPPSRGCPHQWRPVHPQPQNVESTPTVTFVPPAPQSDIFGALSAHLAVVFLCFHFEADVDYIVIINNAIL